MGKAFPGRPVTWYTVAVRPRGAGPAPRRGKDVLFVDAEQNAALFGEMVKCEGELFLWQYDAAGTLLASNCPEQAMLGTAFSVFGCREAMLRHMRQHDTPVALGTSLGAVWGAVFERAKDGVCRAWVLGPVLYSELSMRQLEQGYALYDKLELSLAWKSQLMRLLQKLPCVPNTVLFRYLAMLHYCVNGERLRLAQAFPTAMLPEPAPIAPNKTTDRHRVYAAERALLEMVRCGDLDYADALQTSALLSTGVPVQGRDPLRQAKTSVTVFCTLVCRAAIEGGLSPDAAYSLGDAYLQSCEDAVNMGELMQLPLRMYDDFIRRVHKCRTNPAYSPAVQQCVDYIELHLSERIRAADLAALVGYGEYYITRRFRRETGYSISDYIKFARVERARVLLVSTKDSTQQIADALGFATRSYFSQCFRQVVGQSPAEYRAAAGRG